MPPTHFFHIDAFTDCAFTGNPAAVCITPEQRDSDWMQSVAAEMNLSETAFVWQLSDGFALRWFTPATEVDLCGHATLASAHALWYAGFVTENLPIGFHTKSSTLTCTRDGTFIQLDFPATPAEETTPPEGLLDALGEGSEHRAQSLDPRQGDIGTLGHVAQSRTGRRQPGSRGPVGELATS